MQYTRTDLRGDSRRFASITRNWETSVIDAELITPTGDQRYRVAAADRDAQWSLATTIQTALDGVRGTDGDIRQYFDIIRLFADDAGGGGA